MATKNSKGAGSLTTVTTMDKTQFAILTDANSAATKISKENLISEMREGVDKNLAYSNILIMYHDKSSNYPRMVHLDAWPSLQSDGEIADGVVISEGGKVLVVAPTQAEDYLPWGSAQISGGGVTTSNMRQALNDFAGESNTAAQIKHSELSGDGYAPGFCAAYSRTNANGRGLTAGKWWLPSSGELNMIWAHIDQLNYAISLITGGVAIPSEWHWSSTEYSSSIAWSQFFDRTYGRLYNYTKAGKLRVRAVSAYQS